MANSRPSVPAQAFSPPSYSHWCYECLAEVMAQQPLTGSEAELVCPHCGGGFIEAMDSAQALVDVRRALRRRRRHTPANSTTSSGNGAASEQFDASLRQVLRLLRLLARTARNSTSTSSRYSDTRRGARSRGSRRASDFPEDYGFGRPSSSLFSTRGDVPDGRTEAEIHQTEIFSPSQIQDFATGHDRIGEITEDSLPYVADYTISQEDSLNEREDDSDFEAVAGFLDPSDWDSVNGDDYEWEEAEGNDTVLPVTVLETVDEGFDGRVESLREDGDFIANEQIEVGEVEGSASQLQPESNRLRLMRLSNRLRLIRISLLQRNLHRRLQEIYRNLERQNADFQIEIPEVDTYYGNPEDYMDARGFEDFIQRLIDNDNSRRGAPPAAKFAVESLPTVLIQQENIEDGSALCAICKDVVALDEPAKQLPCLHLYHGVCILRWLSSRNSCPVCRYELPTDDPDYEEQKGVQSSHQSIRSSHSDAVESDWGSSSFHDDGLEESVEEDPVRQTLSSEQGDSVVVTVKEEIEAVTEQTDPIKENHSVSDGELKNSAERSSVLEMITRPLISFIGLVVVSCLGNFFLGSSVQKPSRLERDAQVRSPKETRNSRPWWMCLFS